MNDRMISQDTAAAPNPAAAADVVDLVVCTTRTRVIVTAGSSAAAAQCDRVFLPAWSRMWEGMAPVPVGLLEQDCWAVVARFSRALQVF